MDKLKQRFLFISVIVLILLGLWLIGLIRNTNKLYAYIGQSAVRQPTVVVTGEGKVTVKPDVAIMSFGLVSQNVSLNQAQKDNTEKMNNFLKSLKKDFSVDEKDIQTSNYQMNPRYDWRDGRQTLVGYEVNQNVAVKIRNLEKVGELAALAGQSQLNQVGDLRFTIDDPEKARTEARAKAFAQIKEKAKALSEVSGIKLGKIISLQENSNSGSVPRPMMYAASDMVGKEAAVIAPTVEVGSNEITAQFSVEYEIL
ncbi:MAG: SIMPL domain-containing protein [Candidatus Komeilibacteria bacterium]|nr:SIMPL domain-containing protein [Candidatus Komeilibacteria bacterium]